MNQTEIKIIEKALKICAGDNPDECGKCPYVDECNTFDTIPFSKDVIEYVESLKNTIKKLIHDYMIVNFEVITFEDYLKCAGLSDEEQKTVKDIMGSEVDKYADENYVPIAEENE